VVQVSKKKYIVLDNGTGGRVALEYQREFSSSIPYRQVYTNGDLSFEKTDSNVLKKKQLENYHWQKCQQKEEAILMVEEGFIDEPAGTSDVLSS
jgi:hypothetical protein